MDPRNIRLDLEYDGTGFAGWARQPGLPSVEASLTEVLGQILQEDVSLSVAGRTDSGVHARGQVASLQTASAAPLDTLQRSANKLLRSEIAIKSVCLAPPGFDARRSAVGRRYSYTVLNRPYPSPFKRRFVYYYRGRLELSKLEAAASIIRGKHDFTAFTPAVSEHSYFQRNVNTSEWVCEGDLLIYHISSSSFMRNMVRVLVGTMLEIGRGHRSVDSLNHLLKGAQRSEAGVTAPPSGLCLEEVIY